MGIDPLFSMGRLKQALAKPYYSVVSSHKGKVYFQEAIEAETFQRLCEEVALGQYSGPLAILEHDIPAGKTIDRSPEVAAYVSNYSITMEERPPSDICLFLDFYGFAYHEDRED